MSVSARVVNTRITFDSPADDVNLIKRVVAVGGDTVAMVDNVLVVNGRPAPRHLMEARRVLPTEAGPLAAEIWREQIGAVTVDVARLPERNVVSAFAPVRVPDGHVMVLGDSRDNSNDSRFIGFIDVRRVTGRAVRVALSHNPDAWYLPRADRWWLPLQL